MSTDIAMRSNEDDLFRVARAFAASGYFKDSKEEAQCVVRILAGRELGFGAFASMSGIHIIEGKPAVSAGLMATAIENSGRYAYHLAWEPNDRAPTACAITFYALEGGKRVERGTSRFSLEDAQRAGLAGKNTWRQYPRNLLFARAMSNGCRWYCAGVFGVGAVYTPEELGAEVDADGAPVAAVPPVLHMVDATDMGRGAMSVPVVQAAQGGWSAASLERSARERSHEVPAGKRWSQAQLAWFWASLGDLRPRVTGDELHRVLGVESIHDWPDLDDALERVRQWREAAEDDDAAAMPTNIPAPEDEDEEALGSLLVHPEGSVEWEWERYAALVERVARWNREYPEQRISAAEPPRGATAPQVRAYADGLERRLAKLGVAM